MPANRKVINFLQWIESRHPEMEALRGLSDDELIRLINEFESANLKIAGTPWRYGNEAKNLSKDQKDEPGSSGESFHIILKRERELRGWSQESLAQKLG